MRHRVNALGPHLHEMLSVAEHLHNLSPCSLHSMIECFSAEAWHAILYLITPCRLGNICGGLASASGRGMLFYIYHLGSIRRGLACHSISCHSLTVSAEAWHAILYLITPWQYLPRLGLLFYILSRLGSIHRGLACYFISYHALAVSVEGPTSKNPSYESSSRKKNPRLRKPKLQKPELRKLK